MGEILKTANTSHQTKNKRPLLQTNVKEQPKKLNHSPATVCRPSLRHHPFQLGELLWNTARNLFPKLLTAASPWQAVVRRCGLKSRQQSHLVLDVYSLLIQSYRKWSPARLQHQCALETSAFREQKHHLTFCRELKRNLEFILELICIVGLFNLSSFSHRANSFFSFSLRC